MIEIFIIIAVVKMFTKLAEKKGLSKGLWGFIGAASYYVPILLFSFVIAPALVENGTLDFSTEMSARITLVLMNIAIGVLCCVIAYQVLKSQPVKTLESSEIIDA